LFPSKQWKKVSRNSWVFYHRCHLIKPQGKYFDENKELMENTTEDLEVLENLPAWT
jgi:hypothetical protein